MYQIVHTPLPRVFAIFLNQNRSIALRDQAARQALSAAINREELVATVLAGYGVPTTHPVPPFHSTLQSTSSIASSTAEAATILTTGGWRQNSDGRWEKRIGDDLQILSVTLRTTNNPVFEQTARYVRQTWEALGVAVSIEQYEQSDLLQTVIRPRDFESLLFGLDMNRTVDLYPFWHSSQREDPGLNIAQYANITVDRELVTARTSRETEVRTAALNQVLFEIQKDSPAIFLYVPSLTYVITKNTELTALTGLSRPHERFMNIHEWHMAKEERWPLFR
jgi:peptide/nickel transport system substrate-binding protein